MEWKNPDGSVTGGVVIEDGSGNKITSFAGGGGGGGSNASVGANGAAAPTSATEIGFVNALGNLGAVSASNPLPVAIAADTVTLSVSAATNLVTSDSGVAITGAIMPVGGSGVTGWLSAIWSKLAGTLTISGSVAVANFPSTQAVTLADGADTTLGSKADAIAAVASGAAGTFSLVSVAKQIAAAVAGWLNVNLGVGGATVSATNPVPIYDAFQSAQTVSWTSATAANTALTVDTAGYDTVIYTIAPPSGLTAGAVTFEAYDGANWVTIKASRTDSYFVDTSFTLSGAPGTHSWQLSVAGYPSVRARLSTAIAGAGTVGLVCIVSSAPDVSLVTVGLDPNQPLPAGANTIGGISNTSFAISGTLPAFAAPPTVNLGALNGAATDAHLTNVQSAPGAAQTTALTIQGNASGIAVPVSVSALPALSAGANLIGAVNVDIGGAAISQSNPVPTTETYSSVNTGQISVVSTATLICAGRKEITIVNNSTTMVYLGGSSVTTTTGLLLAGVTGEGITISGGAAIYGIVASGAEPVSFMEVY